jgi:hypothetical protein
MQWSYLCYRSLSPPAEATNMKASGILRYPRVLHYSLLTLRSYTPRKSHRIVVTLEAGDKADVRKKNPTLADVRSCRGNINLV